MKKILCTSLSLCLLLIGCQQQATPIFVETTTFPTDTPPSTITISPTETPEPTKTLAPTVTPTHDPKIYHAGLLKTLGPEADIWYNGALAFNSDGSIVAMTGETIRVWNVSTYQLVYEFNQTHMECIQNNISFSPDGQLLAVSSYNCSPENAPAYLNIYDLNQNKLIDEWALEYAEMYEPGHEDYRISTGAFAFLPDNTRIAVASGNTIEIRDIYESTEPVILDLGNKLFASEISLAGDGTFLFVLMNWEKYLTFPSQYKTEFGIQIWNLQKNSIAREFDFPEINYKSEEMSLNGEYLSHIIFAKSKHEITNLITDEAQEITYRKGLNYLSPDNHFLLVVRYLDFSQSQQNIELWKTENYSHSLYSFKPKFSPEWFYGPVDFAFSPNNKILAISHEQQLTLWNIEPIVYP